MAAGHDKIMMMFGFVCFTPNKTKQTNWVQTKQNKFVSPRGVLFHPASVRQQDAIAFVRARSYFSQERRTPLFCVSQT